MALNFPANPSVGQVYNTGLKTWKWSGNSWTTLGVGEGTVIATSETPPLDPSIGDLWFNDNTAVLSVFYGDGNTDQWVTVSTSSNAEGGGANVVSQETAPADPSAGDLWFNTNTAVLYIYYADNTTLQWVTVTPSIASIGSGASVITSETAPSTPADGDLWFNTSDGNLYVYYVEAGGSSQWVSTVATAADASAVSYTPAGTGAQVTTVQTKLRETVSVKDFGAVGDGVTDDGAAIQSAINAAETYASNNASIYVDGACMVVVDLTGGEYGISETNRLSLGRRIRFQNGTLNAIGDWTGNSVIELTTTSDGAIVDGVNIDGGISADELNGKVSGISSRGTANTIQNCKITHFSDYGIKLWAGSNQVISYCDIAKWKTTDASYAVASSRTGTGIQLESDHNKIMTARVWDCGESVSVESGSGNNGLHGCRFYSAGITNPVGGEGQVRVDFTRAYFIDCYFDGVRVSITSGQYDQNFTSCRFNERLDAEAIYIDTTATNETVGGLAVIGSFFNSSYTTPITFNGTGTYVSDIDKRIHWVGNHNELGNSVWYDAKFGAGALFTDSGALAIADGITTPATLTGAAQIYVDTADGDLKVKFGNGTVKTISVDT
tara:strand:- start:13505 stop:15328 length:1824 start_codon:yes stop_codon:yes gene_type:complete